ncbi:MAG: alpha/beta hydrolase [Paracoccus sp.]|jgi:pimeloyl-ACP methyl ester carboxylesterase|uniref:alpha/beta fold hydrolase n=1 Tax=unclassified Paracoccus (in: a-proteobacteria) TaxID=2688777 RepID=UPI000C3EF0E6|nr:MULTISPECIES: alpha/beta hydrolase [unclassified Paracoccus (in: a-proteobacteria)]MAN55493.1 alpha/beta hydrolase [Paracoccus sp. (in: a-proteobacteria)]|tara:strand:- start:5554 stop:6294 length:741 start_codon:yes stop_codon:yes gene_type:complete
MSDHLTTSEGRRIAYRRIAGQGPGVVFLGGFKSDMQGTKALHLAAWARQSRRAFLRFDYSGHGESGGRFEDGCIGDWAEDARAMIEALTDGPQVLVGSSMGGWIALLLARSMPQRVAGLVTIAAAPDFTEQGFWAGLDPAQREILMRDGRIETPSDYSDEPYVITRHLIEDGRKRLVLNQPLPLPFPVRLLQGTADADVPVDWALRLLDHASGPDIRLVLVKDADHRFSTPECLDLVTASIEGLPV